MKRKITGLLLLAAAAGHVHAQNEVFLCVDDNGKKEYKNTGLTKGCKKIDLPGITMIPAPAPRPAMQAAAKPADVTPTNFPKVDGDTQKARDNDRRQILQYEMKNEEQKLAEFKAEFNNGEPERRGNERNYAKYQERVANLKENIGRTEKNIEALKREIGNLK
jgi:hypothetical protein